MQKIFIYSLNRSINHVRKCYRKNRAYDKLKQTTQPFLAPSMCHKAAGMLGECKNMTEAGKEGDSCWLSPLMKRCHILDRSIHSRFVWATSSGEGPDSRSGNRADTHHTYKENRQHISSENTLKCSCGAAARSHTHTHTQTCNLLIPCQEASMALTRQVW